MTLTPITRPALFLALVLALPARDSLAGKGRTTARAKPAAQRPWHQLSAEEKKAALSDESAPIPGVRFVSLYDLRSATKAQRSFAQKMVLSLVENAVGQEDKVRIGKPSVRGYRFAISDEGKVLGGHTYIVQKMHIPGDSHATNPEYWRDGAFDDKLEFLGGTGVAHDEAQNWDFF